MARYELRLKASVAKDLRGVPRQQVKRILARIESLRDEPRPSGCEKLSTLELYRVRQGVHRIICSIDDTRPVIEVIKVGHRGAVYR